MVVGLFVLVACVCLSRSGSSVFTPQATQLWERVELDCEYCAEDAFKIISAVYGDKVVTGQFNSEYISGEREFPASDAHWGSTGLGTQKKTFVLTFKMCDNVFTKTIKEGQTVILPQ